MKKKPARFHGLLLVDKPGGLTSHDVVGRIRRFAGQRQVGHTGTLDPMATGLMGVLLGQATRLEPFLVKMNKCYEGTVRLGLSTDTDDLTGRVIAEKSGPWPGEAEVAAALAEQVGPSQQMPPAYSAIKIGGRKAYEIARGGGRPELTPRQVTALSLTVIKYDPPELSFRAQVSSGYYIRSLARDLGESLGLGGALTALRRLSVGPWPVEKALSLEAIGALSDDGLSRALIAPAEALPDLPTAVLTGPDLAAFRQGQPRPFKGQALSGPYKVLDADGQLAGLAQIVQTSLGGQAPREPFLRPLRVFNLGSAPNQPDGKE